MLYDIFLNQKQISLNVIHSNLHLFVHIEQMAMFESSVGSGFSRTINNKSEGGGCYKYFFIISITNLTLLCFLGWDFRVLISGALGSASAKTSHTSYVFSCHILPTKPPVRLISIITCKMIITVGELSSLGKKVYIARGGHKWNRECMHYAFMSLFIKTTSLEKRNRHNFVNNKRFAHIFPLRMFNVNLYAVTKNLGHYLKIVFRQPRGSHRPILDKFNTCALEHLYWHW